MAAPQESRFKFPSIGECTHALRWCLWALICVLALGFPNKYLKRLADFEELIPGSDYPSISPKPWSQPKTFSDRGDDSNKKTMRQKQQEEWDRLNSTVSVIIATSAATLAIQATGPSLDSVYCIATAFYSAALGISLHALIIITYMTIAAGGSSDEAIGRLAKGELCGAIRPVAFVMALPAILATYSSFALLAGFVVMIMHGLGKSVTVHGGEYFAVAIIPTGVSFLCLVFTVVLCEVATESESRERANVATSSQSGTERIGEATTLLSEDVCARRNYGASATQTSFLSA